MKLILGIAVIIITLIIVFVSISRTPGGLQGYYGTMFWTIFLGAFVGGVCLILSHFNVI